MDIGTAKPTLAERARVRHHLIDVVAPNEAFDAFRYQKHARAALSEINARGHLAVVVGGTGLYVRALLDGLDLEAMPTDPAFRSALEATAKKDDGRALYEVLRMIDPEAAARVDPRNVRRVVRYLEIAILTGGASGRWRHGEAIPAMKIGLAPPRDVLRRAIDDRVRRMVAAGVVDETRDLMAGGVEASLQSMTAHGYKHWAAHLRGEITLDQAIERTVKDTRDYSRRQMTWFRRDASIRWVDPTVTNATDFVIAQGGTLVG